MRKWTVADIPDQCGRTAIITGANTGLGYETAAALAASGARVVLAVRNLEKGENAIRRIREAHPAARVELQLLDLCSLASVRAAAKALKSNLDTIDLLINNAGVVLAPKSTTADNFEMHFGTNHLGHFALTGLLLDRMLATPGSRVVTVSSLGHRLCPRYSLRRCAVGTYVQPVRRLRSVQAREPSVHLRTSATGPRQRDYRSRCASRWFEHRVQS